jgi:hypothetical protein
MKAIARALPGTPLADNATGTVFYELTGEEGGNEYSGYGKGLPKARFRQWFVARVQPIMDELRVKYDVAATELYIGPARGLPSGSHSIGLGAIQLQTPGTDVRGSFFRTGFAIMHELGHQAQAASVGNWATYQAIWAGQIASAGGAKKAYTNPSTYEYQADTFAADYLGRVVR